MGNTKFLTLIFSPESAHVAAAGSRRIGRDAGGRDRSVKLLHNYRLYREPGVIHRKIDEGERPRV